MHVAIMAVQYYNLIKLGPHIGDEIVISKVWVFFYLTMHLAQQEKLSTVLMLPQQVKSVVGLYTKAYLTVKPQPHWLDVFEVDPSIKEQRVMHVHVHIDPGGNTGNILGSTCNQP